MIRHLIKLLGWDPITARILWKHVGNSLLLIGGAKLIFWAGKYGIDNQETLAKFLWIEDFATLGIVVWFLREMAIEFWNRRKKIRGGKSALLVWILGT